MSSADSSVSPSSGGSGLSPDGLSRSSLLAERATQLRVTLATYLGVGGVLLALIVYLSLTQPQFLTGANFVNIMQTNAALLVIAVGLTFVVLLGAIDLSLGGLVALSGVILGQLLGHGWPETLAIVVVIVAAGSFGLLVNGLLIAKVGLSFLVVTLGTMSITTGAALVISHGQSQVLFSTGLLNTLGTGDVVGVPWSVVIALGLFAVCLVVLRYSGFGRMVYAVGGNPEAARLAGINTTAVRVAAFAIAGATAGLGGVILAGQLAAVDPTAGTSSVLTAAAAVLLGGASFMGGRGTLLGTLLGVLFLGVLANGITLTGVSAFWQGIVTGAVLIAAVALDRVRGRSEP